MFHWTPESRRQIEVMREAYPEPRARLLPLLWLVQGQAGWVPPEAVPMAAQECGMTAAEVEEALSFYTMFLRRPPAAFTIAVCCGSCCRMNGADALLAQLKERLGIGPGERSPDGRVALHTVECLGACDGAPAAQVNGKGYGNCDAGQLLALIEEGA